MSQRHKFSMAAVAIGITALAACESAPPPQEPEIVQVHRTLAPSEKPLVGISIAPTRPVQNVRISIAGNTYPRSASGVLYVRLKPGKHKVTVEYDVTQADGTLGRRTAKKQIDVPDTRNPVRSSITLD